MVKGVAGLFTVIGFGVMEEIVGVAAVEGALIVNGAEKICVPFHNSFTVQLPGRVAGG